MYSHTTQHNTAQQNAHNGSHTAERPTEELMFSLYCVIELSAACHISHPHLSVGADVHALVYLFVYVIQTRAGASYCQSFQGVLWYVQLNGKIHNDTGKCAMTLARWKQTEYHNEVVTVATFLCVELARNAAMWLQGVCGCTCKNRDVQQQSDTKWPSCHPAMNIESAMLYVAYHSTYHT